MVHGRANSYLTPASLISCDAGRDLMRRITSQKTHLTQHSLAKSDTPLMPSGNEGEDREGMDSGDGIVVSCWENEAESGA